MLMQFIKRQFSKNRALIHAKAGQMEGFLHLLTKQRNTSEKWTQEEISLLKSQIIHLSLYIPAMIVIIMPFGMLLLPMLAEILDRRSQKRNHNHARN